MKIKTNEFFDILSTLGFDLFFTIFKKAFLKYDQIITYIIKLLEQYHSINHCSPLTF